jgi:hypothetical protein
MLQVTRRSRILLARTQEAGQATMIVLFAGRRSGTAEFPDSNVEFVGEQITQLLGGLRPRRIVGSAAAGADLLALEAAEALGLDAEAVIAGERDVFRAASVSDKGAAWERRYRHQLDRVATEEIPERATAEEGYRAVTRRILERGEELADEHEAVVVLAVAKSRETVDHSDELVQHASRPGRLVLRIDPARRAAQMPRAFVAMPFGVKPYPERGWRRFDANLSYHRVMLPALIDAGYRPVRADTDALLEVIDHTMLREISGAELMLVDLAMLSASVMWELGLRHAWRRSGTVILRPDWVKRPFDIARVPVFPYRRGARNISDRDAVDAIRMLQSVLSSIPERRVDSPVFASVGALAEVDLPEAPDTGGSGALLEAITRAGDLRDGDGLRALGDRISDSDTLTATARRALLEQTAAHLVELDRYGDARALLEPLARADRALEHLRLQQQYAHVLIRTGERDKQLAVAEGRLEALRRLHGDGGETLGLLGSAAKARVEMAVASGAVPVPSVLDRAISAYRRGMEADPGDPYPGINAVALSRLRGQRWGGGDADIATARELLPVVRFAASAEADDDVWARLTIAECALHSKLLDGEPAALAEVSAMYGHAAAIAEPRQQRSARRQLRLMRDAGDPAEIIDPLLDLL